MASLPMAHYKQDDHRNKTLIVHIILYVNSTLLHTRCATAWDAANDASHEDVA
jgi:hypothetical protein